MTQKVLLLLLLLLLLGKIYFTKTMYLKTNTNMNGFK